MVAVCFVCGKEEYAPDEKWDGTCGKHILYTKIEPAMYSLARFHRMAIDAVQRLSDDRTDYQDLDVELHGEDCLKHAIGFLPSNVHVVEGDNLWELWLDIYQNITD